MSYITNFKYGVSSFGVPLPQSGGSLGFGLTYFVDGTNGNDVNSGESPEEAFATIQTAITAQIANTKGLGDTIYVLPGSYAESLTGTLSKVQIIGVNVGAEVAHAVSVRPTASYAYTGSMTDSAFRNIMFLSPSSTNTTYPALFLTYMGYSTIDNCLFIGRTDACVVGIQIGTSVDDATVVKFDYSSIKNCVFSSFYGEACQFAYGIQLAALTTTNGSVKQMWHSEISNNSIMAKTVGISIGCNVATCRGSIIRNNYIASLEDDNGVVYGISSVDVSNAGIAICHNYIKAQTDCIYNFLDENTFDNYVSVGGAGVVKELPVST